VVGAVNQKGNTKAVTTMQNFTKCGLTSNYTCNKVREAVRPTQIQLTSISDISDKEYLGSIHYKSKVQAICPTLCYPIWEICHLTSLLAFSISQGIKVAMLNVLMKIL
jgi:hypothetical protein